MFTCLNHIELCFAWFCYQCNKFFLNLNGLYDGKVVSFAKNENDSLYESL